MRRLLLLFVSALTLAGLFIAPAPASAAPGCASGWGSIPKVSRARTFAPLTGVRAGRHDCFDRLVLDIAGPVTGYHVGYVERVVMDGSGAPVPLRGDAFLSIAVYAPAHDDGFNPTYTPANRAELADVRDYRTFRQVAWAGSFEGQTTLGVGTRARLPFQVSTLDGPGGGSRVVIDVAHSW
ncbi:AMIN-like domain-containing (lipo)protein [Nocardia beijingensis]|uniref:AMIN-like domain-containing (lipo)protein n=1 Tax=Nocardia beijingensis TaxID=95162 RepID=UPI0033B2D7CC